MSLAEVTTTLATALATVPGLRVYTELGAVLDPPAAVVGPPALTWTGSDSDPSEARYSIAVVVAASERALPELWGLLPRVAAALDAVPDAVVRRADPGTWPAGGGSDLPAYLVDVEVLPW